MKTTSSFLLISLVALTFAITAFLSLLSLARADPFLVCDPQTNVTKYVVTMDGATSIVPAFDLGDGSVRLHYDLADLPPGPHDVKVRAKNVWGASAEVCLNFTKALPDALEGLCIE